MDRDLHSVQYKDGTFVGVGSDGGYLAPNFEDIDEGIFPEECLSDEAKTLLRGYRYLRYTEFFLAGIAAGVLVWSAATDNWLPSILMVIVGILVASLIDVGKKALREALDSEAERREETIHYRKLNQEICLRKFKEDQKNGQPTDGERS